MIKLHVKYNFSFDEKYCEKDVVNDFLSLRKVDN